MNLTHLTPAGLAFILSSGAIAGLIAEWLLCDDDEPDPALSLERLPSSVVREIEDTPGREQTAHLPSVLEELGLL
jgi:hypothetical protein